jgi:hypothetical protein
MKQLFITAYRYLYGGTIKAATEIYRTADKEYINAIIENFRHDVALAFNYD